MNINNKDFRKLNKVLMDTVDLALIYLIHHDSCYKKYGLQTAAWDGVDELRKLSPSLSEPFIRIVNDCINKCDIAKKKMPNANISCKEFPVAAKSMIELAKKVDKILKLHPYLKDGIKSSKLASHTLYANLEEVASGL